MDMPLLSLIIATSALAFVATILIPGRHEQAIKIANALAALATVVLAGLVWQGYDKDLGGLQFTEQLPWIPSIGVDWFLAVDGFGVAMTMLNALVFLTGVLSMWSLKERVKEYFAFMALLVVGVFGVFAAQDVFLFFFFYEVAVLPMYPLIAVWGSTRKRYSAMKLTLYLMGGSALLFPGLLALKSVAGIDSWSIPALAAASIPHEAQLFLYPFLYIGFGILAGMFPFHGWSPTGHVAAPTAVSMLHAGVLMKLGAFGILRIAMTILPEGAQAWALPFAILATVNIVYGAFVAMRQTDFKYVIGFSSVSHMGIVLLGLNTLTIDGVNGAAFQMFAHGVMTALFFSAVGFIYEQTHDRDIRNFGGLVRQVPVAASFFIVAALCGMGVPGFASFWAELLVFIAALDTWPLIGALVIVGLIFTAAYVLRVLGKAMFGPANPKWDHLRDSGVLVSTPRIILVGVLLLLGFFPRLLLDLLEPATQALLRAF
jgi:NADH-quinone oxidoreductase subunit M